MTLGQKLYEMRTGTGLSQLELAEALDVSRQSVSKWETDAAVPEIDKLIAISRYFGVSIGALLGVEEETADAPEQGGELTDAQLKMVEEIVERYVAALPKPMPKKQKLLLKLCASAAAIGLVLMLAGQCRHLQRLDNNYGDLRYSIENVNWNVNRQIDGITNRVEAVLKAQNNLTADYVTEPSAADLRAGTVTFSLRVIPKTFTESMTAWIEVKNSGEKETFGPFAPEGQAFSGEATVKLTDEIDIYVVFERGDTRETQLLDHYDGLLSETRPYIDVLIVDDLRYEEFSMGRLTREDWYAPLQPVAYKPSHFDVPGLSGAEAGRVELGLFLNQRLVVWAEPAPEAPPTFSGFDNWDFYRFPNVDLALAAGDELSLAVRVTDEYGRVFVWSDGGSSYLVEKGEDGTLHLTPQNSELHNGWSDAAMWDFTSSE